MLDLGMQELIVIFIVALIVFGPKRLPELGRTIGKSIAELKRAMHGVKEQIDSEIHAIDKASEEQAHITEAKTGEPGAEDSKPDKTGAREGIAND